MIYIKENLFFDPTLGLILHLKSGIEEVPMHVQLDAKLAGLFHLLLLHKGKLVARQDFVNEVWEGNTWVGEKALTRNISRLRSLLKQHGLEQWCEIKTHPKKGYSLNIEPRPPKRSLFSKPGIFPKKSIWLGLGIVMGIALMSSFFAGQVEDIEEHQVILQDPVDSPIFEDIIRQD